MAVIVPAWFDVNHYLSQKVEQMNDRQYDMNWLKAQGASSWSSDLVQKYINGWPWSASDEEPVPGDTPTEKAYSNFLACNADIYTVNVGQGDINVSGTPLFDVAVYLQNLADYHNAGNSGATAKATLQTELQALLTAKTSAWGYFQEHWAEMPQVNPSNNFDLSAYINARATAEGITQDESIARIHASGLNPIEDYCVWGADHGLDIAPKPATPTRPQFSAGWSVWGEIAEPDSVDKPVPNPPTWSGGSSNGGSSSTPQPGPEPEDPYDRNVTVVDMSAETGEYTGATGQNTRFEATSGGADSTLKATDVITGGEDALNTLAVNLADNWADLMVLTVRMEPQARMLPISGALP